MILDISSSRNSMVRAASCVDGIATMSFRHLYLTNQLEAYADRQSILNGHQIS